MDKKKLYLIGGIGLVSSAFLAAYFLSKKDDRTKNNNNEELTECETEPLLEKSNNRNRKNSDEIIFIKDQTYNKLSSTIKIILESEIKMGSISKKILIEIDKLLIYLIKKVFSDKLKKHEKLRRQILHDLNEYSKLFIDFNNEMKELFKDAKKELFKDIKFTNELYDKFGHKYSLSNPIFDRYRHILIDTAKMEILPELEVSKNITKEKILEMIDFKQKKFKTLDFNGIEYSPEELILIQKNILEDFAFKEFGFNSSVFLTNQKFVIDSDIQKANNELIMLLFNSQTNSLKFPY